MMTEQIANDRIREMRREADRRRTADKVRAAARRDGGGRRGWARKALRRLRPAAA